MYDNIECIAYKVGLSKIDKPINFFKQFLYYVCFSILLNYSFELYNLYTLA